MLALSLKPTDDAAVDSDSARHGNIFNISSQDQYYRYRGDCLEGLSLIEYAALIVIIFFSDAYKRKEGLGYPTIKQILGLRDPSLITSAIIVRANATKESTAAIRTQCDNLRGTKEMESSPLDKYDSIMAIVTDSKEGRYINFHCCLSLHHPMRWEQIQRIRSKFKVPVIKGKLPRIPSRMPASIPAAVKDNIALRYLTLFFPWDEDSGMPVDISSSVRKPLTDTTWATFCKQLHYLATSDWWLLQQRLEMIRSFSKTTTISKKAKFAYFELRKAEMTRSQESVAKAYYANVRNMERKVDNQEIPPEGIFTSKSDEVHGQGGQLGEGGGGRGGGRDDIDALNGKVLTKEEMANEIEAQQLFERVQTMNGKLDNIGRMQKHNKAIFNRFMEIQSTAKKAIEGKVEKGEIVTDKQRQILNKQEQHRQWRMERREEMTSVGHNQTSHCSVLMKKYDAIREKEILAASTASSHEDSVIDRAGVAHDAHPVAALETGHESAYGDGPLPPDAVCLNAGQQQFVRPLYEKARARINHIKDPVHHPVNATPIRRMLLAVPGAGKTTSVQELERQISAYSERVDFNPTSPAAGISCYATTGIACTVMEMGCKTCHSGFFLPVFNKKGSFGLKPLTSDKGA